MTKYGTKYCFWSHDWIWCTLWRFLKANVWPRHGVNLQANASHRCFSVEFYPVLITLWSSLSLFRQSNVLKISVCLQTPACQPDGTGAGWGGQSQCVVKQYSLYKQEWGHYTSHPPQEWQLCSLQQRQHSRQVEIVCHEWGDRTAGEQIWKMEDHIGANLLWSI